MCSIIGVHKIRWHKLSIFHFFSKHWFPIYVSFNPLHERIVRILNKKLLSEITVRELKIWITLILVQNYLMTRNTYLPYGNRHFRENISDLILKAQIWINLSPLLSAVFFSFNLFSDKNLTNPSCRFVSSSQVNWFYQCFLLDWFVWGTYAFFQNPSILHI